jgi:SWI/SNF-related matrix-associated actin-dependent regulator 1 of chromatin subfamily A
MMEKRFREYHPAVVKGGMDDKMRDAEVVRFQTSTQCKIFLGQVVAAGVGLTLTASSHIIFVEGAWSPEDITQCEDRAHRIGQKNSLLIQHLVLEGSMAVKMAQTRVRKQEIIDQILN